MPFITIPSGDPTPTGRAGPHPKTEKGREAHMQRITIRGREPSVLALPGFCSPADGCNLSLN